MLRSAFKFALHESHIDTRALKAVNKLDRIREVSRFGICDCLRSVSDMLDNSLTKP